MIEHGRAEICKGGCGWGSIGCHYLQTTPVYKRHLDTASFTQNGRLIIMRFPPPCSLVLRVISLKPDTLNGKGEGDDKYSVYRRTSAAAGLSTIPGLLPVDHLELCFDTVVSI